MFSNIIHSLFTRGLVSVINFLILIISSRYLGVSSRGEISILLLNLMLIQIFNEIYTGYSLVHFIPRFNLRKIILWGLAYSVICCAALNYLLALADRQVGGQPWLIYLLSLLVVLNTFFCIVLLGREKVRAFNRLSLLQPLLLLAGLLLWIFFLRRYTLESYLLPLLGSFAIAVLFSARFVIGEAQETTDNSVFKPGNIMLKGLYLQLALLMFVFANRYSFYLLPDNRSVGLYACACVLMEAALIVAAGIAPVLLSRVANAEEPAKSAGLALSLAKAAFAISLSFALLIAVIPESWFLLVLGPGFTGIKELMLLYAPAVVVTSFSGTLGQYFSAIGRQRTILICYSLGFLNTLILAPLMISSYGTKGAAITADISFFLMSAAISIVFIHSNRISLNDLLSFRGDFAQLRMLLKRNNLNSGKAVKVQ